jgi:hypothetical protein
MIMVAVAQQPESQVAAAILVRDHHDDLRLVDGPPAGPDHGGLSGRAARRALPQRHSHCVASATATEAADFSAWIT